MFLGWFFLFFGPQLRVLQLVQRPQRRGAETFACDLSWWLRRNGHEAKVVALYPHDGPSAAFSDSDSVLSGDETCFAEHVLDPYLLSQIVMAIRRFRPDVVQCNGGRSVKYAPVARILAPNPLWVYRNIDSPEFWLKSKRARLLMPHLVRAGFDAAVAVSLATLRQVHEIYGFEGCSDAIENGVDFARLATGPTAAESAALLADARLKVLWVGALGPQKRPDVAVEVVARLPQDVSLTMLGEGPWRGRVESTIERLGLGRRVNMVGNRGDVGDIMRAADLLLVTSDTEGIPAVVVEAQHCGLPVVAFDVGGLRECVAANGPGRLVKHGDVQALVAAIQDVGKVARLQETRDACTAYAERFGIERIGPLYLSFFQAHIQAKLEKK